MNASSQGPPAGNHAHPRPTHGLHRELGVPGATMMGLGAIVGTGVFVSIGVAAGITGPSVILAILLAAVVATCNALSSAQLAASYAVSGGTYEYGYRCLSPALGFTAGWMFLCAKSASGATAALGFAGYVSHALELDARVWLLPLALAAVVALTAIVAAGIRRATWANILIVTVTLAALLLFVLAGAPTLFREGTTHLTPFFDTGTGAGSAIARFLEATALMFVAYTGYGRIATLGEEVRDPQKTIPRAIIVTVAISAALYAAVSLVAVGTMGAEALGRATQSGAAPLEVAAGRFGWSALSWIVACGAITAMLGVLLNLLLGLSRVLLAMARRGDMPGRIARLDRAGRTPFLAVVVTGALIAAIVLVGSVRLTWSFSAFTVLVYYALTNIAALRLRPDQRRYAPAIAWCGLVGCLGLAFWVEPRVWIAGLLLVGAGLVWHHVARRFSHRHNPTP